MSRRPRAIRSGTVWLIVVLTGLACAPNETARRARQARVELGNITTGLGEYSESVLAALAAEEGLAPGTGVSGQAEANALEGTWTGSLKDQQTGLEEPVALTFGPSGELQQLTLYAGDLIKAVVRFEAPPPSGKIVINTRAVAANVSTDDGIHFKLVAMTLFDQALGGDSRRTLEVFEIDFTLEAAIERLSGSLRRTIELLGSSIAGDLIGLRIAFRGSAEAVKNESPVANAGEDIVVRDADGDGVEEIRLDGTGSIDPDGSIVGYVWRRDGEMLGSGPTLATSLPVGTHEITLAVTDDDGAVDIDEIVIAVE